MNIIFLNTVPFPSFTCSRGVLFSRVAGAMQGSVLAPGIWVNRFRSKPDRVAVWRRQTSPSLAHSLM